MVLTGRMHISERSLTKYLQVLSKTPLWSCEIRINWLELFYRLFHTSNTLQSIEVISHV